MFGQPEAGGQHLGEQVRVFVEAAGLHEGIDARVQLLVSGAVASARASQPYFVHHRPFKFITGSGRN
ncbi:MAG: hypothetical protein E6J42_00035 [Chloroflexi bacterium]|nr:MAG: hypothetical protein E6J42_00035 [Chloroflexota bacterium]